MRRPLTEQEAHIQELLAAYEGREEAARRLERAQEQDCLAARCFSTVLDAAALFLPDGRAILAIYGSRCYQIQHLSNKILIEVVPVMELTP